MKISVFGLGYVGCVTAACLARDGHHVVGVDVNQNKVELLKSGNSPIAEPGLDDLLDHMVSEGYLKATLDCNAAIQDSNLTLICVGTPSNPNGQINLNFIENVCSEIGTALKDKQSYHIVVVRSTVLPGTVDEKLIPLLEKNSQKRAGPDFGVCMNPEFLREGSAISDYDHPGTIVIGELDQQSGDGLAQIYKSVGAPMIRTRIAVAEMTKYVSNAYHALKIVFANEIGTLCKAHGIDGQEVMSNFCQDDRLNISPVYLKPGFAFGGSCLPKDVRSLTYRAKERDVETPVLNALIPSNKQHIQRGIDMIEKAGRHKIGILGLSFKNNTDDVRESPAIALVEVLAGRGYEVSIYDENVEPNKLVGANRTFLERELPHIAQLMRSSIEAVLSEAEVIVVTNKSANFGDVFQKMRADQILIDLVGITKNSKTIKGRYEGICW
jgi:GDP-mannose 6-dehydrogenase